MASGEIDVRATEDGIRRYLVDALRAFDRGRSALPPLLFEDPPHSRHPFEVPDPHLDGEQAARLRPVRERVEELRKIFSQFNDPLGRIVHRDGLIARIRGRREIPFRPGTRDEIVDAVRVYEEDLERLRAEFVALAPTGIPSDRGWDWQEVLREASRD